MGPLKGVRVLEMSNIGPGPFCGMLLADLGADVLRVDRLAASDLGFAIDPRYDLLNRGKQAVAIDLKNPEGIAAVRELAAKADLLIEGYRPGVMEKLGLGPDVLLGDNPALVYGRMTGWGQAGSYAPMAGHDINYIGAVGALASIGPKDGVPIPPLNLVGDFGGGSLYLAMGLLAALLEARQSGQGQVIDAAMVDGVASLMTMHLGFLQAGIWQNGRGTNSLDGGSPYYRCYRTNDGHFMAVGAIELRFYGILLDRLGLDPATLPDRENPAEWDRLAAVFEAEFARKSRDQWIEVFHGSDACVTPVYDIEEMATSPIARERSLFTPADGVMAPAPAPRFSRTAPDAPTGTRNPSAITHESLTAWGIDAGRIGELAAIGVIPADAPAR